MYTYINFDRHKNEHGSTSDIVDSSALLHPAVSSGDFKLALELKQQR